MQIFGFSMEYVLRNALEWVFKEVCLIRLNNLTKLVKYSS